MSLKAENDYIFWNFGGAGPLWPLACLRLCTALSGLKVHVLNKMLWPFTTSARTRSKPFLAKPSSRNFSQEKISTRFIMTSIKYFDLSPHVHTPEVYGVWNFWLRLRSCFGWMHSDSAPTPKHFKVLDSDSCLNSKVNYLNFWQCLNDRIWFSH